jgi:PAS domain S-box-containing protein
MEHFSKITTLFEKFTTGVVIHDSCGEVLFANSAALKLLSLSKEQMLGKALTDSYWRFIREDGTTMPLDEFPVTQVISSNDEIKNFVVGVVESDLVHPTWVLCNAHPEFDLTGELLFIIVNFTDITEQKRAEEKLSEQLDFTKSLIDSMPDGFSVLDKTGTQVDVNSALCQMTGFSREELIGQSPPFPYWPPEDYASIQMAFDKVLAQEIVSLEMTFMRKNGERFPVIVAPSYIKDKNNNTLSYLANVKDITTLKQAELKLKAALEVAKKAVKVKSRFLDIAAHELRTPVTTFSILLQLAEKKLEKGIPVELSLLTKLRSQVERISKLIIELLDVSRLERGVLTLSSTRTNLVSMISQCIENQGLREPSRRIIFTRPSESIEIDIDGLRVSQVISNLIENAIKYTPQNTPIEISVEQKPEVVRVSVKDYGPGISEQQQKDLFSPFSRGETELTDKTSGLGLGLFISQEIIELHGGTIGVSSKMSSGSTFYFELPTVNKKI